MVEETGKYRSCTRKDVHAKAGDDGNPPARSAARGGGGGMDPKDLASLVGGGGAGTGTRDDPLERPSSIATRARALAGVVITTNHAPNLTAPAPATVQGMSTIDTGGDPQPRSGAPPARSSPVCAVATPPPCSRRHALGEAAPACGNRLPGEHHKPLAARLLQSPPSFAVQLRTHSGLSPAAEVRIQPGRAARRAFVRRGRETQTRYTTQKAAHGTRGFSASLGPRSEDVFHS